VQYQNLAGNSEGYHESGYRPLRLRGLYAAHRFEETKEFAKRNGHKSWPIVRFDNGEERTMYRDCAFIEHDLTKPYNVLSRKRLPLIAGYAITIHKSQVIHYFQRDMAIPNSSRACHSRVLS
jgi:hypothetical protein